MFSTTRASDQAPTRSSFTYTAFWISPISVVGSKLSSPQFTDKGHRSQLPIYGTDIFSSDPCNDPSTSSLTLAINGPILHVFLLPSDLQLQLHNIAHKPLVRQLHQSLPIKTFHLTLTCAIWCLTVAGVNPFLIQPD